MNNKNKSNELLAKCPELLEFGNFQEALELIKKAQKLSPDNPGVFIHYAYLYDRMGETQLAIDNYLKAINLVPDRADLYFNLGWDYLSTKQYSQSIDAYTIARGLDPSFSDSCFHHIGQAYIQLEKFNEAVFALSQAVKLNPIYVAAYNDLAYAYLQLGDTDTAVKIYHRIIEINPTLPETYRHLANVYLVKNLYELAKVNLEKLLELDPESTAAYFDLANIFLKQNNLPGAQSTFANLLKISRDRILNNYKIAMTYADFKHYNLALEHLYTVKDLRKKFNEKLSKLNHYNFQIISTDIDDNFDQDVDRFIQEFNKIVEK